MFNPFFFYVKSGRPSQKITLIIASSCDNFKPQIAMTIFFCTTLCWERIYKIYQTTLFCMLRSPKVTARLRAKLLFCDCPDVGWQGKLMTIFVSIVRVYVRLLGGTYPAVCLGDRRRRRVTLLRHYRVHSLLQITVFELKWQQETHTDSGISLRCNNKDLKGSIMVALFWRGQREQSWVSQYVLRGSDAEKGRCAGSAALQSTS
jgi:hypothetical protein